MKPSSTPPEFWRLGSCFIRDDAKDAKWAREHFPEWAKRAIALANFLPAQINSLKAFLDEILSSTDDYYVDTMWNSMGAPLRVYVHGKAPASTGGMTRGWFKTIRELLDTVKVKSLEDGR